MLLLGRWAPVVALALALATGCAGNEFTLRVASPPGAHMIVESGTWTIERDLPIPFTARFAPANFQAPYPIVLKIPREVARRELGTDRDIDIPGELYIRSATDLTRDQVVDLVIPTRLVFPASEEGASTMLFYADQAVGDETLRKSLAVVVVD